MHGLNKPPCRISGIDKNELDGISAVKRCISYLAGMEDLIEEDAFVIPLIVVAGFNFPLIDAVIKAQTSGEFKPSFPNHMTPLLAYSADLILLVWFIGFGILGLLLHRHIKPLLANSRLAEGIASKALNNEAKADYSSLLGQGWSFNDIWNLKSLLPAAWERRKPGGCLHWRCGPRAIGLFYVISGLFMLLSAFIDDHLGALFAFSKFTWADFLHWASFALITAAVVFAAALHYRRCIWHTELLGYLRAYIAKQQQQAGAAAQPGDVS